MTVDRVIGANNDLPWTLPEDLQLFKALTLGNTVIMGHKTYATIGKPLQDRHNIVLSKHAPRLADAQVCSSLIEALAAAGKQGKPVFIIGGAEVYKKALPIVTEMHISWIKEKHQGDVFFPDFELDEWKILQKKTYSDFTYTLYRRK
jgi:dihydrofolate reductase